RSGCPSRASTSPRCWVRVWMRSRRWSASWRNGGCSRERAGPGRTRRRRARRRIAAGADPRPVDRRCPRCCLRRCRTPERPGRLRRHRRLSGRVQLTRGVRAAGLAAGADRGNEVLAHLGAITGLPMAANCTLVTPDEGKTHRLVRHRWAGLLLEDAVMEAPVALFTVATDSVANVSAETPSVVQVHVHKPELVEADLVVRAAESPAGAGGASLATARVVVGGGRGVGGPDGFAPLEELAELLGGVVGVSRVVTSEGWRPHKQQVGQTGTKITPELYPACGISGAIQHIAGCASAKHIIAINTDPGAPILAHADYAVIGDLHQVIPALIEALRAR